MLKRVFFLLFFYSFHLFGEDLSINDKTIRLGYLGCLNGPTGYVGKPLYEGLKIRIDLENERKGGLKGKFINLIPFDTKYDIKETNEIIKKLSHQKIDILLSSQGSFTFKEIMPQIMNNEILAIFPYVTSSEFRKSTYKNLIHLIPSAKSEVKALAKYALKENIIKKDENNFLLCYQDEPYSKDAFNGVKEIFESEGIKINEKNVAEHEVGSININSIVEKIKNNKFQNIFFLSTFNALKETIKKMDSNFLLKVKFFLISSILEPGLSNLKKEYNINSIESHILPLLDQKNDFKLINEFQEIAKSKNININDHSIKGYVIADIFLDLVKDIKQLTKKNIISKIESVKKYNYKGLILDFNPKTRELLNTIWLKTEKNNIEAIEI